MKIISAIITAMPRPMPEGMFDPMPEVVATFEDGTTKPLFSFYPDEITFQASEFIGLTEQEAKALRHRKDVTFLKS
jgi:molybdopterin-guanine dinucleotide biosynthesis protein A